MLLDLLRYWWKPSTYNAGMILHRIRFRMSVEERKYFHHFTFRETPLEAFFRLRLEHLADAVASAQVRTYDESLRRNPVTDSPMTEPDGNG
jgi:hypothetical protein